MNLTTDQKSTIDLINLRVCAHYDINQAELDLKTRGKRNIPEARMMAMYLVWRATDLTTPAIGMAYSGRVHTTVLHACRYTQSNPDLAQTIDLILTEEDRKELNL